MLTVGDKFPEFNLKATVSERAEQRVRGHHATTAFPGKWLVVFFYPKDFTFVCPTEIAGFAKLERQFKDRDAQVLGARPTASSCTTPGARDHKDLKSLPFPMLADIKRELRLGARHPRRGRRRAARDVHRRPEGHHPVRVGAPT